MPDNLPAGSITRTIFRMVVGIVAIAFLGLAILADLHSKAQEAPAVITCRSNAVFCLSRIEQWARENRAYSSLPLRESNSLVFTKYLVNPPRCPSGQAYCFGQPNGLVVCPQHDVRKRHPRTRWLGIRISIGSDSSCLANLKQIEGAIETWALETRQPEGAIVDKSYFEYLYKPECPSGGVYLASTTGERPRCTHELMGYDRLDRHPSHDYTVRDRWFESIIRCGFLQRLLR